MSDIETPLVARMRAYAPLAALVGKRIYPGLAPQNADLPRITYMVVGGSELMDLQGPSGFGQARFQVDGWADTYSDILEVATGIREALHGMTGADLGASYIGLVRLVAPATISIDETGERQDAKERPIRRARQDFFISYFPSRVNRLGA